MSYEYWVAQHVPDLLRNEPRNVGVFLKSENGYLARFFGELEANKFDHRKFKSFENAGAYKQWVEFWRDSLVSNSEPDLQEEEFNFMVKSTVQHFRIHRGGAIDFSAQTQPDQMMESLFAMLVSSSFEKHVENQDDDTDVPKQFIEDISAEFAARNLLDTENDGIVTHPVKRNAIVIGKSTVEHRVDFFQDAYKPTAIEVVDFTGRGKPQKRDRAIRSAYVLKDLKKQQSGQNINVVSVVRIDDESLEMKDIKYGMTVLENESDIVKWDDIGPRNSLIENIRTAALAN